MYKLVRTFLVAVILLVGYLVEGNAKRSPSPNPGNHNEKKEAETHNLSPSNNKADQQPPCDFKVVISEPDFCVIQGRTYDMDVKLIPIAGTCSGSATLSMSGLPAGISKEILPSPKMRFRKGVAAATVRIDTARVVLKDEAATSSLFFVVSKKDIVRRVKAKIMVDLPSFDFSLKPNPTRVRLHQEDSASTTVKVKLLGGGCQRERPVILSLDASSLPSFVSYEFSSESIIPPEKSTLSFKASSGMEIGVFKATLIGCCTDGNFKKTVDIPVHVTFPRPSKSVSMGEEVFPFPSIEGTFQVDSMESVFKAFKISGELKELTRKVDEEIAIKGYITVPEEKIQRLKESKARALPMKQVIDHLTFEPTSIKGTPFEQFRMEGGYAWGGEDDYGKSTMAARIFSMSNGVIIKLSENDLLTSGGYAVYSKEGINERINNFPAVLLVEQAASGNAITSIVWTTTTTDYTLEMEGNVRKNGQYDFFLNLARSITK